MTIEEICNKYIKVKATGILALHQHPKQDCVRYCEEKITITTFTYISIKQ